MIPWLLRCPLTVGHAATATTQPLEVGEAGTSVRYLLLRRDAYSDNVSVSAIIQAL